MYQKEKYWRVALSCLLSFAVFSGYSQGDVEFQIDHILLPNQSGTITVAISQQSYLQAPFTVVASYPDGSQVSRSSNGNEVFSGLSMPGQYCFGIQSANGCIAERCVNLLVCRITTFGEICEHITDDDGGHDVVIFGLLAGTGGIDQMNYMSELHPTTSSLEIMQQATSDEIDFVISGGNSSHSDQGIPSDIKDTYDFASVFTLNGQGLGTMTHFWINDAESRGAQPRKESSDLVNVYPNPTTNYITVHSVISPIDEIAVYDNASRLLKEYKALNSNQFQADLSSMASGVLLLRVQLENGLTRYKKVVKLLD